MSSFARLDLRSVEAVRLPVGRRHGDKYLSSGSSNPTKDLLICCPGCRSCSGGANHEALKFDGLERTHEALFQKS